MRILAIALLVFLILGLVLIVLILGVFLLLGILLPVATTLRLVALALILIILVVFLILLILVLVLLLLLLLKILNQLFDDVAVLLGPGVHGIALDHGLVVLECIFPIRQLGIVFLGCLTGTDKGVGQVVGGGITDLRLGRSHCLGEIARRLLEIAGLVGGGTGIEFYLGNRFPGFEPLFKILKRSLIISLLVIVQS